MSSTVTTITQANSSGNVKIVLKCVETGSIAKDASKSWSNDRRGLLHT